MWHNIIEFNEPVKTVEQASRQVDAERIVKSIVMIDSNGEPLLAIVAAKSKISHRKLKDLLDVKDVRLASSAEVLLHSGYPVGAVLPFNKIRRVIVDPKVLRNETAIFGGGDIDKLLEVRTRDVVEVSNGRINDITQEVTETQSS